MRYLLTLIFMSLVFSQNVIARNKTTVVSTKGDCSPVALMSGSNTVDEDRDFDIQLCDTQECVAIASAIAGRAVAGNCGSKDCQCIASKDPSQCGSVVGLAILAMDPSLCPADDVNCKAITQGKALNCQAGSQEDVEDGFDPSAYQIQVRIPVQATYQSHEEELAAAREYEAQRLAAEQAQLEAEKAAINKKYQREAEQYLSQCHFAQPSSQQQFRPPVKKKKKRKFCTIL